MGNFATADAALLALVDGLYIRQNVGYDFAAWAHVLRENRQLLDCDILYLVNDSTIGPLSERKFEELLARVRSSESDVVGLTDSYERGWHIQSYFIALKPAALSSPAFWAFIAKIKNLADKKSVVNAYETRFAPTLQAAGLRCEVLFPTHKSHNPSLMDWRALINSGLPFVKLAALRNSWRSNFWRSNFWRSNIGRTSSWRTFGNAGWRKILQSEGFDCRLAEEALAARERPASEFATVRRKLGERTSESKDTGNSMISSVAFPVSKFPACFDRIGHVCRHGRACPGHPRLVCGPKDVDARNKCGHDGGARRAKRALNEWPRYDRNFKFAALI